MTEPIIPQEQTETKQPEKTEAELYKELKDTGIIGQLNEPRPRQKKIAALICLIAALVFAFSFQSLIGAAVALAICAILYAQSIEDKLMQRGIL